MSVSYTHLQRLDALLKRLAAHFIEKQRKDNGSRKSKEDLQKTDRQRVGDKAGKIIAREKINKVLHAAHRGPRTSPNSLAGRKILERDDAAVHGQIMKQQIVNHHGDRQSVYAAVHAEIAPEHLPVGSPGGR